MTDIVERAEIVLKVPGIIIGKGLVQDLVNELKITRDLSDGEYARGAASVEDRYTDDNAALSLDMEELLAVATIYLDAFKEGEMMSLTEKVRLQKIEEIVERRGRRY